MGNVTSVNEIFDQREAEVNQIYQRTYKRIWRVTTDSALVGPIQAGMAVPVSIGQRYNNSSSGGTEFDFSAWCQNIRVADAGDGDGKSWLVTATYGPFDSNQTPRDPTLWVPKVRWNWAQFETIAAEDNQQNPVVNSAFDYFDPPIMKDDSRPILQIVRNEFSFDQNLADDYRDTINSDSFWGYPPKYVKCSNISAERVFNNDIGWYWEVSYEFAINRDTWQFKILDQGYRQLNAGGTAQVPILVQGAAVSSPALLDGNGKALAPNGTPVFTPFDIYEEKAFAAFGFDQLYNDLSSGGANALNSGNPIYGF